VNSWALSWGTKQWWDEDCEIQKINNKDLKHLSSSKNMQNM
jgi:hypothetical protein